MTTSDDDDDMTESKDQSENKSKDRNMNKNLSMNESMNAERLNLRSTSADGGGSLLNQLSICQLLDCC